MRILMTVSSTSLMDGINRHVLAIAGGLNQLPDVEVGVVTLHPWGDFNDALRAAGVACWSFGCTNGHQLKVLPRFCRVMHAFKPDIVHSHVLAWGEAVALKWRYPQVKRVGTVHGISDPVAKVTAKMRMMRLLDVLSAQTPDHRLFISDGVMRTSQPDAVPRNVVYNPMPFNDVDRPSSRGERLIIGTACRVAEVKSPLVFTQVMGEVTRRVPNSEAWIVGDGISLEACKKLARDCGYDRIRFLGSRNDAKDLIARMDCFVMTSKREGMPGALLEAMSVKTPIAFMKGEGGLADLAEMNKKEGPFAVVVEQGDEQGMVDGVCDLLNDTAKRSAYAARAFEAGKRHFDIAVVVKQLRGVYESVVAR